MPAKPDNDTISLTVTILSIIEQTRGRDAALHAAQYMILAASAVLAHEQGEDEALATLHAAGDAVASAR